MKRIIPALVALLVSGPAWADDDDAVLLTCTGNYIEKATTENITIARDGSWIDFGSKITRTKNMGDVWIYKEEADGNRDIMKMNIYFNPDTLGITAIYNPSRSQGRGPSIFRGGCSPIKNPLKY